MQEMHYEVFVHQSEVLAASFIPSSSCVRLFRTSPWPFWYVVVLNRGGLYAGAIFHRLATLAEALAIASCQTATTTSPRGEIVDATL